MEDGEHIRSTVAGPGSFEGNTETWYQLATTDARVLAVQLQKNALGNYQPMKRMVAPKAHIQIRRYGATSTTSARLEIDGLDAPIVLVDIDRPDIFPLIEPFIVQWGGRLGGDGAQKPSLAIRSNPGLEEKKMILLAAGLFGITIFFCGCAGLMGGLLTYTQGIQ